MNQQGWANTNAMLKQMGVDRQSVYFVFRTPSEDGQTHDFLLDCDYYTPAGADSFDRRLLFYCPYCMCRRRLTGAIVGGKMVPQPVWSDIDARTGAMPFQEEFMPSPIEVKLSKRDFDVQLDGWLTWEGKRYEPIVYGVGGVVLTCPACTEANDDRVMQMRFTRPGLAVQVGDSKLWPKARIGAA